MTSSIRIFLIVLAIAMIVLVPAFGQDNSAPALYQEFNTENIAQGIYRYSYNTPNNINVQESGKYDPDGNYVVDGTYVYIDRLTNKVYRVDYYADKNGYHPRFSISPLIGSTDIAYGGYGPRQVATMLG